MSANKACTSRGSLPSSFGHLLTKSATTEVCVWSEQSWRWQVESWMLSSVDVISCNALRWYHGDEQRRQWRDDSLKGWGRTRATRGEADTRGTEANWRVLLDSLVSRYWKISNWFFPLKTQSIRGSKQKKRKRTDHVFDPYTPIAIRNQKHH